MLDVTERQLTLETAEPVEILDGMHDNQLSSCADRLFRLIDSDGPSFTCLDFILNLDPCRKETISVGQMPKIERKM